MLHHSLLKSVSQLAAGNRNTRIFRAAADDAALDDDDDGLDVSQIIIMIALALALALGLALGLAMAPLPGRLPVQQS